MKKTYGFIIDTDSYSGNFEREMCAFMTGHIGECEVGDDEAEEYLEEYALVDGVTSFPDGHGCWRPCEAYETPGIWNNGLGFEFVSGEEDLALEKYKEYLIKEDLLWIDRYEEYKKTLPHDWTIESLNAAQDKRRSDIEAHKLITECNKYPAYCSVIIFFNNIPSVDQIAFLKERALLFKSRYLSKIIGFRLMEKEVIEQILYTDI